MMNSKITRTLLLCFSLLVHQAATGSDRELRKIYLDKAGSYPLRTHHLLENGEPEYVNELIRQTSPYLLQHAHNPVNWHPWGEAAFELARKQDKPVFLSVGYSTCHWCHVMERESFEDKVIADFINQNFIPVKVDREEHPDVDEVYLTAVQMLSGKVGWPLTAVLTPEAEAFFGATYLSPQQLTGLLEKISTTWQNRREAVLEQAARTTRALTRRNQQTKDTKKINKQALQSARASIAADLFAPPKYNQPGFPREPEMLFLIDQIYHDMDAPTISKLTERLGIIANGGIHDHVGGGFHRYSVDSEWKIPHFEKMLYNQAQMGDVYARAYQLSGETWLRDIAANSFEFILTSMTGPQGGFYSAMDAESDGKEGTFYTWSYEDLKSTLKTSEFERLQNAFNISENGNFEGRNVLIMQADQAHSDPEIGAIIAKLAAARQSRNAPATDKKIISSWNGLTISSLISGFLATKNQRWRDAALKAANLIWERSWDEKQGLARTVPSDANRINGTLEDYAYFGRAMIDLYDLTGEAKWLQRAEQLANRMVASFYDEQSGGFYISRQDSGSKLIVPLITARDDAITSGNSIAAQLLGRLYRRTGEVKYRTIARSLVARFSNQLIENPQSLSGMLIAASILNIGETGPVQYAAKGNLRIDTRQDNDLFKVNIDIKPGWHVNANEVLQNYLIPTRLTADDASCVPLADASYPQGKLVSLGFQKEQLMVYEGEVQIESGIKAQPQTGCKLVATELRIQGCTDEVCASPERLTIRTGLH